MRHVQFRMSRRLACIVGLSLVSATDFLIYTVDPRDWTTNQINAVWLFGRDTPGHALCRRSPFAFCPLPFCCTWERNLTCVADLFAATSRTHRGQYWSLQCEDVGGTQPVRHRGGDLRRPQFFPNQNPSLVSSTFPATCLFASVMSISVTACTVASSSHKDSTLLSLIFLVVSTAQSFLESSQNHRVLHSSV